MKKIVLLSGLFLFMLPALLTAQISIDPVAAKPQSFEPNTVFIKHPAANNSDVYFAEATMFHFEIYKSGGKTDLETALTKLRADKQVESCSEGVVTGDFQAVTVTLKSPQSKAWFVKWMRAAGFKTIKINNNPPVALEKL